MISLIKAIIFDFGGVIGTNSNQKIFATISNKFGLESEKIKEVYFKIIPLALINQITPMDFWKKLAEGLNIKNFDKLNSVWIKTYKENAKLNSELIYLVKILKASGFQLAILSNLANIYRNYTIAKKIENLFDFVIYSCDTKAKKPERVIFNELINKLNVNPYQCIYIDDDQNNLEIPFDIGINTILYQSFNQFIENLSVFFKISKF